VSPGGQHAATVRVAEIEHHWSALVGRTRFDDAGRALQDLLDQLEQEHPEDAGPDAVQAAQLAHASAHRHNPPQPPDV